MRSIFSLIILFVLTASPASADELMIYPAQGQDKETQEKDEFDCYKWAKEQSGFDPMAPPPQTEAAVEQDSKKRSVLRGAAGGAAVGAVIDGGDGAVKGAAAGAVIGSVRKRREEREQEEARAGREQQQAVAYAEQRNNYNRAYAACLEGRGYTVK